MTPRQRVHAAVRGQERDRVPVVPIFMQWAAHHVRRTYREYYLEARVLAESQIAVATALGTDQVSAISDPFREADDFGLELDYPAEGVGIPRAALLRSDADFERLRAPDVGRWRRMRDRVEAVEALAATVGHTHSVLGWVEGPLAEYVDLRGMEAAMLDLLDDPARYQRAAEVLVDNACRFARAQVDAGADMIGVGDAAASLLSPALYERLVRPWETRLFDAIHAMGVPVRLHICGNIRPILHLIAGTGADVIDVDWMVPLAEARRAVGTGIALCGNFDPAAVLLAGTPDLVARAAASCIADGGDRFLLMPGCEVPPGTPLANLEAFCPAPGGRCGVDLAWRGPAR